MKFFLTAVVLMFVLKGIIYILFPKQVKLCAQRLLGTSDTQLILFGWILVLVFTAAWLSYVRYLP